MTPKNSNIQRTDGGHIFRLSDRLIMRIFPHGGIGLKDTLWEGSFILTKEELDEMLEALKGIEND